MELCWRSTSYCACARCGVYAHCLLACTALCPHSLIIIGDTVGLVITHMMDTAVTATTRRVIIGVTATVVILPLSLVKNMAMLSRSSAVSIGAVLWIVGFVVIKAIVGVGDDVVVPTTSEERQVHVVSTNFFPAVGVIAFAFVCHHSCFIVFNSLKVRATPPRVFGCLLCVVLLSLL